MKQGLEKTVTTPDAFVEMLNNHAAGVIEKSPKSALYVATVRLRAQQALKLISDQSGEVKGVVISWTEDIQPIAETLFGIGGLLSIYLGIRNFLG
jgi:hypothetical protein